MGRVIAAFKQFFDDAGDPLANGWLEFLESGSTSTKKNTYSDYNYLTVNANPLQLDAAGRCPNVHGTGTYRVRSYTKNIEDEAEVGELVQQFDPVTAENTLSGGTGASFDAWDSTVTYGVGDIVSSSGNYYRSLTASNLNNNPAVSTARWEQVAFVEYYNANITYAEGDMVRYGNSLWFSLQNSNTANTPDSSPTWWSNGPDLSGGTIGFSGSPVDTIYVDTIGGTGDEVSELYVTDIVAFRIGFDGVIPPFVSIYESAGTLYVANLTGDIQLATTGNIEVGGDLIPNGVISVGTSGAPFDFGYFEELNTEVADRTASFKVAPTAYFVNAADGGPYIFNTVLDLPITLTHDTWETVGPTGSGATNIWTALNGVPADVDWIEVKAYSFMTNISTAAGTTSTLYAHIRAQGSSVATGGQSRVVGLSFTEPNTGSGDARNVTTFRIPINNTDRIFEAHWVLSNYPNVSSTIDLVITGWGFNPK